MSHREYDRDDLVPKICERLAGGEPLTKICLDIGISRRTVRLWAQDDEVIAEQLRQARTDFIETHQDECLVIADQSSIDRGQIERDRLRIWTRMQLVDRCKGGSPAHRGNEAPIGPQLNDPDSDIP